MQTRGSVRAAQNTNNENQGLEGVLSQWLECQGHQSPGSQCSQLSPSARTEEELQMRQHFISPQHWPRFFFFFGHACIHAGFTLTYESSKAHRGTSVFDINFFYSAGCLGF